MKAIMRIHFLLKLQLKILTLLKNKDLKNILLGDMLELGSKI